MKTMRYSDAVDLITRKKYAYQLWLKSIPDIVREDLMEFCRANATCFHMDERVSSALEGRREVWLRFQEFAEIPLDELVERFTGQPKPKDTEQ